MLVHSAQVQHQMSTQWEKAIWIIRAKPCSWIGSSSKSKDQPLHWVQESEPQEWNQLTGEVKHSNSYKWWKVLQLGISSKQTSLSMLKPRLRRRRRNLSPDSHSTQGHHTIISQRNHLVCQLVGRRTGLRRDPQPRWARWVSRIVSMQKRQKWC